VFAEQLKKLEEEDRAQEEARQEELRRQQEEADILTAARRPRNSGWAKSPSEIQKSAPAVAMFWSVRRYSASRSGRCGHPREGLAAVHRAVSEVFKMPRLVGQRKTGCRYISPTCGERGIVAIRCPSFKFI